MYCIGGLLAVLAWHSHAQANQPDPSGADVVPPVTYQSPLHSYRGFEHQTPGDWREANATVGRIGGWQAYAAEVWEASQSQDDGADADIDNAADAGGDANPHQHH
ncbi:hypothetical protein EAO82_03900 [Halopseudomonas pelagia]|uniref:Secreted protein n=2 Tax=Halopseudomonas pelagia TaxID=553151 RepID=A0ABX6CM37_9GAMM|nr:hypothetical protein EAO82_03900 [Halopseudomonas pelagia]